ncbi:DUF6325 family protein [Gryllotalpicola protaetiae]|uniref:DUF1269 domain-containing protein n=1 Tax=Gryllotalpicola protaetiae TaxID=2419771 RepID=A0A387BK82_9MICO|nr:DUF6325 family protein [Gryllotalpicola protaetiae]AYG03048.1 hypothetical protein D7I44_05580 [Gryllotalpicola protaetiae]
MTESSFSGPIDYLVFAFPPGAAVDAGLARLLEAVDRGQIEVLDLEVIRRGPDGSGIRQRLGELGLGGDIDLSVFDGAESGILDEEDLATIAAGIDPDGFALALVYLEHSLDATAQAWGTVGGVPLLEGGIDPLELADAVDAIAPAPVTSTEED